MAQKVIKVTRQYYELENGDIFEHTFDLGDDISVEAFQNCLDNARFVMREMLNKVDTGRF